MYSAHGSCGYVSLIAVIPTGSATDTLHVLPVVKVTLNNVRPFLLPEGSLCVPLNVLRSTYAVTDTTKKNLLDRHTICMSSVIETMWITRTKHFFHGKSCSHQSLKIHIHILRKCHHVFFLWCVWEHLWPILSSMWSAQLLMLYLCFSLQEQWQRTLRVLVHMHKCLWPFRYAHAAMYPQNLWTCLTSVHTCICSLRAAMHTTHYWFGQTKYCVPLNSLEAHITPLSQQQRTQGPFMQQATFIPLLSYWYMKIRICMIWNDQTRTKCLKLTRLFVVKREEANGLPNHCWCSSMIMYYYWFQIIGLSNSMATITFFYTAHSLKKWDLFA